MILNKMIGDGYKKQYYTNPLRSFEAISALIRLFEINTRGAVTFIDKKKQGWDGNQCVI